LQACFGTEKEVHAMNKQDDGFSRTAAALLIVVAVVVVLMVVVAAMGVFMVGGGRGS
jgi:hypothetical protein